MNHLYCGDALALALGHSGRLLLVFWYAVGDLGIAFACTAFFTFVLARYSLAVMAHSLGRQSLPDQSPPADQEPPALEFRHAIAQVHPEGLSAPP